MLCFLNRHARTNPSPKWCGGWAVGEATWPVARRAGRGAGAPPGALSPQTWRGCLSGALPQAKRSEFPRHRPMAEHRSAVRTADHRPRSHPHGPAATPRPANQPGTHPPAQAPNTPPTAQVTPRTHLEAHLPINPSTEIRASTEAQSAPQATQARKNLSFKFNSLQAQISAFPRQSPNGLCFANDNTPACNCTGPPQGVHTHATPRALPANGDKHHD